MIRTLSIASLLLGACTLSNEGSGTKPDAQPTIDAPPAIDGPNFQPEAKENPLTPPGNYNPNHQLGQDCLTCHNALGDDMKLQIGGTLYPAIDSNNSQNMGGYIVRIIDAQGKSIKLVTLADGNFYYPKAGHDYDGGKALDIVFPVTTYVTATPNLEPMISKVSEAGGSCALSGCHTANGGAGRVWIAPVQ